MNMNMVLVNKGRLDEYIAGMNAGQISVMDGVQVTRYSGADGKNVVVVDGSGEDVILIAQ